MSGRGKRSGSDGDYDDGIDKTKAGLGLALLICGLVITAPYWMPFLNVPWTPETEKGLQLTGTVHVANHTAVSGTSYTSAFVNPEDRTTAYTGVISGGTFTTNEGPLEGGTFDWYIGITGCMLFVDQVTVPVAKDYDQSKYFVGEALIYRSTSGSNWNVLMTAGSVSNSFTGGGSAATTNFTAGAGVTTNFDFKVTNTYDYSKLFREYTDPYDAGEEGEDVEVNPVLWIELGAATGIFTTDTGVHTWNAGSTTYMIMPISQLTATGTQDVSQHFDINIVVSSAQNITIKAWIVDGSSYEYLKTAHSRVANPYSGETVTVHSLLSSYLQVS
ncbi:MAG: hypothetical protein ACW968_02745 [Candidatus Thorarchaeota archaeon]